MGSISVNDKYWDFPIYLIGHLEPIMGGDDGASNKQPKQFAHSTEFLRELFLVEHDEAGRHCITDASVAADAGIAEAKLALEHSIYELLTADNAVKAELDALEAALAEIFGNDGEKLKSLARAIRLNWNNADNGYAFELWSPEMCLVNRCWYSYIDDENGKLKTAARVWPVTRSVDPDDSLDVDVSCLDDAGSGHKASFEDVLENLMVGDRFLFSDGDYKTFIQLSEVLPTADFDTSRTVRVKATEPVEWMSSTATLSKTDIRVIGGVGYADPGCYYYSDVITVLQNSSQGQCVVRVPINSAAPDLVVTDSSGTDHRLQSEEARYIENGYADYVYTIPFGGDIRLSVLNETDGIIQIKHMSVFPKFASSQIAPVLKPEITSVHNGDSLYRDTLTLGCSRYASAWQDKLARIEYVLTHVASGRAYRFWRTPDVNDTAATMTLPYQASELAEPVTIDGDEYTYFGNVPAGAPASDRAPSEDALGLPAAFTLTCRFVTDQEGTVSGGIARAGDGFAYAGYGDIEENPYAYSAWSEPVQFTLQKDRIYFATSKLASDGVTIVNHPKGGPFTTWDRMDTDAPFRTRANSNPTTFAFAETEAEASDIYGFGNGWFI